MWINLYEYYQHFWMAKQGIVNQINDIYPKKSSEKDYYNLRQKLV
ncbi:hypothetical protein [Dapis sp. BLCC M229]